MCYNLRQIVTFCKEMILDMANMPKDDIRFLRTLHDGNAIFAYKEHSKNLKNANAFEMAIHIHPNAEFLIVTSGEISIQKADKSLEIIHPGEAALLFPFQPHGYSRQINTEYFRISFSSFLAKSFFKANENVIGEKAVFSPKLEDTMPFLNKLHKNERPTLYKIKGFIYSMLDDYLSQVALTKKNSDQQLLNKIIFYIDEHKLESITLGDVANAIGYNEKYLSRFINKASTLSFTTLLATLRMDDAKTLLIDTDKTMLEIAMDCGFGSERTFYRYFNELVGMSPKSYRKQNNHPAKVLDDILL